MNPCLTVYDDPAAMFADTSEHLETREAENGLLLGLLQQTVRPPRFLARYHAGDRTLGVAYLSHIALIVSRGMQDAHGPLQAALHERRIDVPGLVGPEEDVVALAGAWGRPVQHVVEQGLYELRAIDWPSGVPGRMRAMDEADVDRVADWVWGFHQDALPHEPYREADALENARARPAAGMTYLWEVDGAPVAMAALARPTRRTITVNAVYTPPEHRGRGYASALVAAISAEGLGRGKAACVLYTDLANPTSNAIYQRIGYRPIGRSRVVRFS
jgi:hypothetical protein